MRSVWGLAVALTGLFFVWLWATGRAGKAWDAVIGNQGNALNVANLDLSKIVPSTDWSAVISNNSQNPALQLPNSGLSGFGLGVPNGGSYGGFGLQVQAPWINVPTYVPPFGSSIPAGSK